MTSKILLTGASRRVGLQLCKALTEKGYTVIAVSRTPPKDKVKNTIYFNADLCTREDRENLIDFIKNEHPRLRAIIHNASLWLDDSLNNLEEMYKLHIEAPFHINTRLNQNLESPNKSDIIHICDESASRGSSSHIGYASTKAALQNLTLSFAQAFAPQIRVNSISPGLLILKENHDDNYKKKTFKKALLEFEPGADPLIHAVLYLLESSYSTGSNIVVNGGRHLKKGYNND
ncbi:dihydromonapterin reductase [Pseudomonas alcaligenes]|jgi:dihydromonapterin reductase/dihydrofolate reductase|uniref:dihydromonapterin reductase n=1 Tax=Aquipseudomonas alcaligenes TaxID=43263 RepID=UPI002E7B465A|nr:dihydromonapterin reductase [Pseudomonas alcaligenes]MEE1950105.1 dihydromonapterin reductase [Pseudomonas alcaligenes]